MVACEIHLNRRGINSVELPAQAQVEAGKSLVLSFNNHGHPLHVSISAKNSAGFTSFTHENLFVQGETEYEIPVSGEARDGAFSLEVVTGYGRTRAEMKVLVQRPPPQKVEEKVEQKPAGVRVPWMKIGPPALGLVLYGASLASGIGVLKDLAFLVLLAGLLIPWLQQG
jgi:hypothetical protein